MSNAKSVEALKKWREEHPDGPPRSDPKNLMEKWQDKDTRKTAIEAKCWECCGGSAEYVTGVRAAIRECTAQRCPLFNWRPYK